MVSRILLDQHEDMVEIEDNHIQELISLSKRKGFAHFLAIAGSIHLGRCEQEIGVDLIIQAATRGSNRGKRMLLNLGESIE